MPEFIGFDDDVGETENEEILPDGYECVKRLVYKSKLDLTELNYRVHSSDPVVSMQIKSLIKNYINFIKEQEKD